MTAIAHCTCAYCVEKRAEAQAKPKKNTRTQYQRERRYLRQMVRQIERAENGLLLRTLWNNFPDVEVDGQTVYLRHAYQKLGEARAIIEASLAAKK